MLTSLNEKAQTRAGSRHPSFGGGGTQTCEPQQSDQNQRQSASHQIDALHDIVINSGLQSKYLMPVEYLRFNVNGSAAADLLAVSGSATASRSSVQPGIGSAGGFKPTGGWFWQKSAFLPEHPDNRRISAHIGLGRRLIASRANPLLMRDSCVRRVARSLNRTQEVGGSNRQREGGMGGQGTTTAARSPRSRSSGTRRRRRSCCGGGRLARGGCRFALAGRWPWRPSVRRPGGARRFREFAERPL